MPRSRRVRAATVAVAALLALLVPPLLVVNAFRVLATETFTRWELDRQAPDRYGLSEDERETLALTGLRSIQPGSEGIALLERATLPDGSPAFDERELAHMDDVRTLFGVALRGQAIALLAIVVAALALARTPLRRAVPAGLLAGALGTLAVALLAVPTILLGFDDFFTGFHEVFFEGDSWRFSSTDTLIRLYPERFWEDVSRIAAGIAVAQALILAPLAFWWLRVAGGRRRADAAP